jgi:hypothetical protein
MNFIFQQKKNDNGIKLLNISPEIFHIITNTVSYTNFYLHLKYFVFINNNVLSFWYIYGGIISLNKQEPSEILNILAAVDQLHLQELVA